MFIFVYFEKLVKEKREHQPTNSFVATSDKPVKNIFWQFGNTELAGISY